MAYETLYIICDENRVCEFVSVCVGSTLPNTHLYVRVCECARTCAHICI